MTKKTQKANEATCAVTGTVLPAGEMLRFVAAPDGLVVLDLQHTLPGQGLSLIASALVVKQAANEGRFNALHPDAHLPDDLIRHVEGRIRKRLIDLLHLAKRSGAVIGGYEKARSVLMQEEAEMLFQAHDASERGRSKLSNMAKAQDIETFNVLSRADMEALTGRDNQVHLVVKHSGLNAEIYTLCGWLSEF